MSVGPLWRSCYLVIDSDDGECSDAMQSLDLLATSSRLSGSLDPHLRDRAAEHRDTTRTKVGPHARRIRWRLPEPPRRIYSTQRPVYQTGSTSTD